MEALAPAALFVIGVAALAAVLLWPEPKDVDPFTADDFADLAEARAPQNEEADR